MSKRKERKNRVTNWLKGRIDSRLEKLESGANVSFKQRFINGGHHVKNTTLAVVNTSPGDIGRGIKNTAVDGVTKVSAAYQGAKLGVKVADKAAKIVNEFNTEE